MTVLVTAAYSTPSGPAAMGRVHFDAVLPSGNLAPSVTAELDASGAISIALPTGTYRVVERVGVTSRSPFPIVLSSALDGFTYALTPSSPSDSSDWSAADSGQIARTFDPALCTVAVAPGVGILNLLGIRIRSTTTTTGVTMAQAAAGTLMTSGQNFFALFNSTGTRVAITADLSTTLAAPNQLVNPTWVTPAVLVPGAYWIGVLLNSTGVVPTLRTAMSTSASYNLSVNANLTAATFRFAVNGSGQTAMPASIAPASNTAGPGWWAAIR